MLGASIGVRLNPRTNAFVSYDAEIRGKDVANLVSGGVKVRVVAPWPHERRIRQSGAKLPHSG